MKILYFGSIPTWAGGHQENGLANVVYNLAVYISQIEGVDATLAATDVETSFIQGNLKVLGRGKRMLLTQMLKHPLISLCYLIFLLKHRKIIPRTQSFIRMFLKGVYLHQALELVKPDILHLHEAYSWLYIYLVPKSIKIVVTIHGSYGICKNVPNHKAYSVLEQNILICRNISAVYFISHYLEKEFIQYYKQITTKTNVILNSYDCKSFYYIVPHEHDGINLCTIGTIQERKGQQRVIEGIAKSNKKYNYYTIGAGKEETIAKLTAYAKKMGVKYQHLGEMAPQKIRDCLSDMDYMILPSSSEGFGLVYIESIACGVPVILPKNLPIVRESNIINPSKNALLLDNHTPDAIAAVLNSLNKDRFNHSCVADSMKSLSWQEIANLYYESYKDLFMK